LPREGYKSLSLYGTTYEAFMAKMREMGFASPSFFIEFMMRGVAPCTQGVVGSNPTQSTRNFSQAQKFHQNHQFMPSGSNVQGSCSAANLPAGPSDSIVPYDGRGFEGHIRGFVDFYVTELSKQRTTAKEHASYIRKFLRGYPPTREGVANFIASYNGHPAAKANAIKAMRRYLRDYLGQPALIEGFRMPPAGVACIMLPDQGGMDRFPDALEGKKDRAIFLLLASSGMRKMEALGLQRGQVDLGRMVAVPMAHAGETKRDWLGFFNAEARDAIGDWLNSRNDRKEKLFPLQPLAFKRSWKAASEKSGVKITPKVLRFWFADRMDQLGVSERYINAFCGRIPRSVLAKHYTDYSYRRMKQVYDRAGLKVLG